jgi:hypothetical protein
MAVFGYVQTLINALDAAVRVPVGNAFEYTLRELSLGANAKADNFNWYKVSGTTHATANTEFSVVHGMDHAPTKLIPMLKLDSTGGALVALTVSRVADSKRIYLKCASTSVAFVGYLE